MVRTVRKLFACLNGALALVTWFFHEAIRSWFFDKVVQQMNSVEADLIQYGPPVIFAAICIWLLVVPRQTRHPAKGAGIDRPVGEKPALKPTMSGGSIFEPGAPDMAKSHTGIAINAKVWNVGGASVATSWALKVIIPGRLPVSGQLTQIPDFLSLSGAINSVVIRGDDALDRKVATEVIGGTPIEGTLLFYVPLPRSAVMTPDTVLKLSFKDILEVQTVKAQRLGDWKHR